MHEAELRCLSRVSHVTPPVGGRAKRTFDFTFALFAIVFFAPLFILVIAIIRLSDGGPAIYRHTRVGRNGRIFSCLKFRTMVLDADDVLKRYLEADEASAKEWMNTRKLKNDPRITPLGQALRKTSLDELPQLINILRGDMSIVGPRPIVAAEISHYGLHIHEYYCARPGLTGLWQISGRNDVRYEDRVRLDCHYVRNWSIQQDIVIIVRTIPAVISSSGCY